MKTITSKKALFIPVLLVMLFTMTFAGYSQSVWFESPANESLVGIEAMIPSFEDGFGFESPSSAYYVYSHIPLNSNIALQLDLPVSHLSVSDSETAIGNPYIGIQTISKSDLKFDLGIRLPLAPDDNIGILTGTFIENYKVGPFVPNTFSGIANIHYRYDAESGFSLRLDGGPEVLFPGEGGGELFLKYGGQILYNIDQFTIGTGIIGRLVATEDELTFSERSINSLGFTGAYDFGTVNFGSYVEIPLNDDASTFSLGEDFLNAVIGLNLSFTF